MKDDIYSIDVKNITRNLLFVNERSVLSDDSFPPTSDFNDELPQEDDTVLPQAESEEILSFDISKMK